MLSSGVLYAKDPLIAGKLDVAIRGIIVDIDEEDVEALDDFSMAKLIVTSYFY